MIRSGEARLVGWSVGRDKCYTQGLLLCLAPSFVGKPRSPLGYLRRYPSSIVKIPIPTYSQLLIETLLVSVVGTAFYLHTLQMSGPSTKMSVLAGGNRPTKNGLIVSWESDLIDQVFRARLSNTSNRSMIVGVDPDRLEAIIRVASLDGSDYEFAEQGYANSMKIALWFPPKQTIKKHSSINWSVPFNEIELLEYPPSISFAEAVKSGNAVVQSIHGLEYIYIE